MEIYLNSMSRIKKFIGIASKYETDIDLVSGRFIVDAKSILGIFSLDLSKPLTVVATDKSEEEKLFKEISKFTTYAKVA